MPSYTYVSHHPVQRTRIATLDLRDPVWTEVVNAGSTLTAKITVPDNLNKIEQIRQATQPKQAAIYVDNGFGGIAWGGIVTSRSWDGDTNELTITVLEWRSWLYNVIVGPKLDGSGGNVYVYTAVDQFTLARNVIDIIETEGVTGGIPPISYGAEVSGITRSLTILGTSFDSAGKIIDSIANQDNGFEWDLEPYYAGDGLPQLRLQMYLPQRGGLIPSLYFSKTAGHGNIIDNDPIAENADSSAARVWAVGEGPNAESLPFAQDSSPDLADGYLLRTDVATTYNGQISIPMLAALARAERDFRAVPLASLSFTVRIDAPDILSYYKGDRARLRIEDRFNDIDLDNVRIISREIHPDAGTVKLTVDLNDVDTPEVDDGGTV